MLSTINRFENIKSETQLIDLKISNQKHKCVPEGRGNSTTTPTFEQSFRGLLPSRVQNQGSNKTKQDSQHGFQNGELAVRPKMTNYRQQEAKHFKKCRH